MLKHKILLTGAIVSLIAPAGAFADCKQMGEQATQAYNQAYATQVEAGQPNPAVDNAVKVFQQVIDAGCYLPPQFTAKYPQGDDGTRVTS